MRSNKPSQMRWIWANTDPLTKWLGVLMPLFVAMIGGAWAMYQHTHPTAIPNTPVNSDRVVATSTSAESSLPPNTTTEVDCQFTGPRAIGAQGSVTFLCRLLPNSKVVVTVSGPVEIQPPPNFGDIAPKSVNATLELSNTITAVTANIPGPQAQSSLTVWQAASPQVQVDNSGKLNGVIRMNSCKWYEERNCDLSGVHVVAHTT